MPDRTVLADGVDCYVFVRHDESGESALPPLDMLKTAPDPAPAVCGG